MGQIPIGDRAVIQPANSLPHLSCLPNPKTGESWNG
jgi:hypothetical protein